MNCSLTVAPSGPGWIAGLSWRHPGLLKRRLTRVHRNTVARVAHLGLTLVPPQPHTWIRPETFVYLPGVPVLTHRHFLWASTALLPSLAPHALPAACWKLLWLHYGLGVLVVSSRWADWGSSRRPHGGRIGSPLVSQHRRKG